jgi:hypothetical protein
MYEGRHAVLDRARVKLLKSISRVTFYVLKKVFGVRARNTYMLKLSIDCVKLHRWRAARVPVPELGTRHFGGGALGGGEGAACEKRAVVAVK